MGLWTFATGTDGNTPWLRDDYSSKNMMFIRQNVNQMVSYVDNMSTVTYVLQVLASVHLSGIAGAWCGRFRSGAVPAFVVEPSRILASPRHCKGRSVFVVDF